MPKLQRREHGDASLIDLHHGGEVRTIATIAGNNLYIVFSKRSWRPNDADMTLTDPSDMTEIRETILNLAKRGSWRNTSGLAFFKAGVQVDITHETDQNIVKALS